MASVYAPGFAPTLRGDQKPTSDTGEQYRLEWIDVVVDATKDNLLGNGAANITFSEAISTFGCNQISVGIVSAAAVELRLRVKGVGDDNTKATFLQAGIDGAAIAAGVKVWTVGTNEFVIENGAPNRFLDLPWAWHYVMFGVYANGAVPAGARVALHVQRTNAGGGVSSM